jgi:hypothetical protein
LRGSVAGRRRAFAKLVRGFGAGAVLEGLRLEGAHPLAVWSMLKPRSSVLIDKDDFRPAGQDGVVNYVLAGALPPARDGRIYAVAEGLWSLEIPDHALGRVMHRAPNMTPEAIIAAAHHHLLRLRAAVVLPDRRVDPQRRNFCCVPVPAVSSARYLPHQTRRSAARCRSLPKRTPGSPMTC